MRPPRQREGPAAGRAGSWSAGPLGPWEGGWAGAGRQDSRTGHLSDRPEREPHPFHRCTGDSATGEWTCGLPQPSPQMQKEDNLMTPDSCKTTCQRGAGTIPFDFGRGCHPLR